MITKEEVQHIAHLARITVSQEDIERFQKEFSSILEMFEQLQSVDVSGIEPMTHSVALQNVSREDIPQKQNSQVVNALISLSPQRKDGYLKVQEIFEQGKKK